MKLSPPHTIGRASLASCFWLAAAPLLAQATTWPLGGATLAPASREQARAVLTQHDEFAERLSPFDRAVRMKTEQPVTTEQVLRHIAEHTEEWTSEELAQLAPAVEAVNKKIAGWNLALPDKILLVKLTGKIDGGAAYTRGDAIMLPADTVSWAQPRLERLIAHELFHVLSRRNPELRQKLYQVVGFEPCGEIELPASLRDRKITNPDAPRNDYCAKLMIDGRPVYVVPILYASTPKYDPSQGGDLFDYLTFRLLVVEREGERWSPVLKEGEPVLLEAKATPAYFESIGRNTQYIIHPEEVLADNFVLLLDAPANVPTPRILEGMKALLAPPPRSF